MDADILQELEYVRKKDNGLLFPESVVTYAENKDTALHNKFEWDDTKAGHNYRLWQARHLIKTVVYIEPNTEKSFQLYVNLQEDRCENGGYRVTTEVLSDDELRMKMLNDAFRDFDYWRQKYDQLNELVEVFNTIENVKRKTKKPRKER